MTVFDMDEQYSLFSSVWLYYVNVLPGDAMHDLVVDLQVGCETTKKPHQSSWRAGLADLLQAYATTMSRTLELMQNHNINIISVLTLNRMS